MAETSSSTKVITGPKTRFSFVHVFEPKAMSEGSVPKYSVSLIISKKDKATIDAVRAAIKAAYEKDSDKIKGNGKTMPTLASIKTPLRDGDTERPDDEAYEGSYFINANSTLKPGIVDAACHDIIDRSEVYSGCYGRASITFFGYNVNGNRGIAASLNHLQKIKDGGPLGGRTTAASDFGAYEDDEEDVDFLN